MTTRGPVQRQVERPIRDMGASGYLYQVGIRRAWRSTLVLRRPWPVTPQQILDWAPSDTVHMREVVADGHVIGWIAAHKPSPYNAARPTHYVFRSTDGTVVLDDSYLDGLRAQIDRAYPEGAELPTRED